MGKCLYVSLGWFGTRFVPWSLAPPKREGKGWGYGMQTSRPGPYPLPVCPWTAAHAEDCGISRGLGASFWGWQGHLRV